MQINRTCGPSLLFCKKLKTLFEGAIASNCQCLKNWDDRLQSKLILLSVTKRLIKTPEYNFYWLRTYKEHFVQESLFNFSKLFLSLLPGPGACLSLVHTHFAVCAGRGSRSRVPGQDGRREGEGTGYGVDDRPVDTLQKQRKINCNCCNRSIQNARNVMKEGQHCAAHCLQGKKLPDIKWRQ